MRTGDVLDVVEIEAWPLVVPLDNGDERRDEAELEPQPAQPGATRP